MSRLRSLMAGLLLAGFGVGLAVVVAEVGVRSLHLVPTRFWEPDPVLGSRLIPGKEGWWTQEELEFRVPVRINSAGWRDVEHALVKPAGVYRIVILGDSFIEAMQVPLQDTVGRRLEQELNQLPGGVRYEVISLGVSGYGTASELLAYRDIGRLYSPDLVLLAFYPGNDIHNNSPKLETVLAPVYAEDGSLDHVAAASKSTTGRVSLLGRILNNWQAYHFVRKMVLTQHPAIARWLVDIGLVQPGAVMKSPVRAGVPPDYLVYASVKDSDWQDAWRHTESLLTEFRRMVKGNGSRFVLAIVAGREQVDRRSWDEIVRTHPAMQEGDWNVYGPEQRLARWCDENGMTCLRLSVAFLAAQGGAGALHYHYDGHWTPAGHRLAAETIAGFLRDRDILPR
jgi:hypothetical protein